MSGPLLAAVVGVLALGLALYIDWKRGYFR
jgi:hypothetical protein